MAKKVKKKGLSLFDTIAFAFSAIFVLDSFSAAAAIGWQSIIFWVILAFIYFLPYGLITAELGAAYSDGGGIYTWVKRAFGSKWAARTNWFYYLNVGLWMASVYIAFSSTISYMINPNVSLNPWIQVGIAIVITWLTVLFGLMDLKYTKWIPNVSTICKVVVTVGLIVAMIIWLAQGHGVATPINDPNYGIVPSWSTGIVFLPVIIYNLSGFELSSNAVSEMKNPKRDIPRSTLIAGVTIVLAYLVGTVAVNIIVPMSEKFDISNGVIYTLGQVFPPAINIIFGILLLITLFGSMITWTFGANRAIQEAGQDGEFQKIFASQNKHGAPIFATILTGIISTVMLLFAGLMSIGQSQVSDIFWTIYAFSSIIFLLPYLLIFPSFVVLRKKDPAINRPFKLPGKPWVIWLVTILPMIILVLSIILFIFGDLIVGKKTIAWNDGGMAITLELVGTAIVVAVGELLIWLQSKKKQETKLLRKAIEKGALSYE